MSLVAGTRLGPYEIQSAIGAGGMGEVYKAHDTRLDRTVAIKILPAELSADPDRRVRLEREARAIAALSHPHICTLHDIGTHDGTTYLVMEFLPGQTLADRLRKGPLPLAQALDIAAQIADALDAAHKHGIIHRDLKPGNVMLTGGGSGRSGVMSAKLLDFGLAKLVAHGERPALTSDASAPTQTVPMTARGTVVGTLQYMAPEQLEGKEADARTDLWALGALVYEMVTGRRAFVGDTEVSLIGNIMNAEPAALSTAQPVTPPVLDRIVRRCLAKSPDNRWESAHDVADELRWAEETIRTKAASTAGPPRRLGLRAASWVATGLVTGLLLGSAWRWSTGGARQVRHSPVSVTIPLTTEQVGTVGQFSRFAISPDGQTVVMREDTGLVRRPLDSFGTTPISGTQDAQWPAFDPDGSELAFIANGRIRRVRLTGGGSAADVAMAPAGPGLTWGEDGRIYFAAGVGAGIWRVPAAGGGVPEAVTRLDESTGDSAHAQPQLLPGERALLFTVLGPSGGSHDAHLAVEVLATHDRRTLIDKAVGGQYVDSGHLIFARSDGTVYAVRFDVKTLQTMGTPVPVLSPVRTSTWGGSMFLAVAKNGTIAFVRPTQQPEYLFRTVDAQGRPAKTSVPFDSATLAQVGLTSNLRVAPDGQRFVVSGRTPGSADLWILDPRTTQAERLTFGTEEDELPVWSPDGKTIAYTSAQPGTSRRILLQTLGSAVEVRVIGTWPRHAHVTSWSPDGRRLTLEESSPTAGWDLWVIQVGGGEPLPIANRPGEQRSARFSPDGRWIAYQSDESGRAEVYVVAADGRGSLRQVSADGGMQPAWDSSGRILYYLQRGRLVAHEVSLGPAFSMGRATAMFATTAVQFDVAPDHHLVLTEPNNAPPGSPLHLVFNWFEELKAKVPAGGAGK